MRHCKKCGGCFEDRFDLCATDGELLQHSLLGSRILGRRYRLDERLDSGAMGVVYRATHLEVGSAVAVKVLVPEAADSRSSTTPRPRPTSLGASSLS